MRGRSQPIVAAAASLLVLVVVFFVMVRPRQNELGEVRDEVTAERDRTQQLEVELARLEELRDNAPKLQAELDRIREAVPRENEVANFIFQVEDAANSAGVGFIQITPELPKPPPEGAPLAEVRFTIGSGGGYYALEDFIRRLYSLDRAVRIDGLQMTGVEGEEAADGRVSATLTARAFFELPEGAAATTTAPGTTTETPAPATETPAPAAP